MSSRKKFSSEASVILLLVFITSLVIATPLIDFTSPTYTNDTHTANRSIPINVSIVEEDLASLYYSWNGTNYTIFNNSLVFMMNFDNLSSLGENNSNAVDASKYGNNGTVYGAAWNSSGKYEGAYSFDGDDDYIAVVDSMFDFTGDFTVSFWIKPASNNENNGLISKDSLPGTAHPYTSEFAFDLRDTNNIWFVIGTTTPWGWHFANSTSTLNAGNWYHITGTVNGFNMILYVNGIEEANVSREGYGRRSDSNNPIKIGVNPDYVNFVDPKYFNGSIDELRIWNRSLSVNEVFQQYVSNFNKFNSTQLYFYVNQTKNATIGLDDGTYTYQIFAENSSGIINTTELRTITVDTTPPIVTINTPSNGSTIYNQTPELNATFGGETVAYAWYSVNNTENSTPISNTNNLTVTFLPLPSGAHNITVYANDSLGNLNSSIVNFAIDTSAPVVTASKTYLDYAQINPMTIDSNITVTDADTNVTGARVSIGDGYVSIEDYLNYTTTNGITGSYSTTTGILTLTGNRSGSDYQAAFRNVTYWNSNTNNPNTSQRNVTFAIGNNSLYYPGTGHYYEFFSTTLTWTNAKTAADGKTFYGLQGYLATVNSSEENTFIYEKVSGDAWIGASDSAVEGDWKWVTGPEAGTLFYRGTGASHTTFGYNNWASGEPNDASNEDVAEMYSTGGGTWNDLSGTSPLSYLVEYGGMVGDPTLHLTAMVIVNVSDIMPPAAPAINMPENGAALTSSYTWVNGTTSADTANVTVYVNGTITNASVAVSSNQFKISNVPLGADGVHEINVSAKDAAGNVNTTNATVTVTVDTVAPSITIISPVNTTYSNASIVLDVTSNQDANVTYSLNGAENQSLYNLTTSGNTIITGTEGENNITVYASDSAGNLNYSTVNFTIDTTPPSLSVNPVTSPTNVTYQNITGIVSDGSGTGIGAVTVNGIAAINGTGYFYHNLTGLVLGNNTITVIATDLADNVATKTTYILVISEVPAITGYAPSSFVSDSTGATRTFNVSINQVANVTWYLNGTGLYTNTSVTEANYTNLSASPGTWNITAIVNNTNGTDSQEWKWIVMADNMPPVIKISVPVNNSNISIFDRIISGSITDDSAITCDMYVNSVFAKNWSSKGSFRWLHNFTNGTNIINISATDAYNNINWTNISFFILSPMNEAVVNLTVNQSVNISANASTGVDVVLTTGNNIANVTVKINASVNESYFNVRDIDDEFVSLGISRKSLEKFVEINATGDVVNLSVVKITMFYNDSDLDLNGNGIIDAGDIKEDTLNLYWHWNNNTSGNQEWFPLTPGADYSGKLDGNNNSGPIVSSVERNTGFKYISASTNHFSLYSIAGEPIPATTTTITGGSGSGGSGVVTAEPFENIARYEMIERNLEAGKPIIYTFTQDQAIVYEVSVTGKENEYDVSMRIEILKDRSRQVKENAPGLVYRNVNIISGTRNIGENAIKFKVNNSWLLENGFNSSDIRLVKWVDNKWITLETGVLFNKDGYTHFNAKSMTFSTYAITGIKKEELMPAPSAIEKTAIISETLSTEDPTPGPEVKTQLWIWMILAMLLIAALVYVLKRR